MSISNYADLQSAIADWLNRADLTARIPDFITLAEADLNRTLRVRDMIVRATATISTQYTPLPTDYLQAETLQINTTTVARTHELVFKTPEQMRLERVRLYSLPGEPRIFTSLGLLLEVGPTPDQPYQSEMAYYQRIPALSIGPNWLIAKNPDLYLYAALMHSAPYLQDDQKLQTWVAAYDRILARVESEDDNAKFSGSTPRASFRKLG